MAVPTGFSHKSYGKPVIVNWRVNHLPTDEAKKHKLHPYFDFEFPGISVVRLI